ncbi:MAG: SDR family oxidoreductase [Deltaproteobacteria bacterium]|nr:SDR family oxidoreductase [Deltaproteobacteria bacterium]
MARSPAMGDARTGAVFLTGGTSFLGRRLLLELVRTGRPAFVLAQPDELPRAHAAVARVTRRYPSPRGSVLLFAGDALEPGLDLPGETAERVLGEATVFVHALSFGPGPRRTAERAAMDNVRALESVLAFAHRSRALESFLLVSSTEVSGDYPGTFYEDWFDVGQHFIDGLDRSVFEMEARARDARRTLPLVCVRPGLVVGDAETGEIDRGHGLGPLVRLLRMGRGWPAWLPWPAPEGGKCIVPLSPADYVVKAIVALASMRAFRGHAYALVDPQSPTLRELMDDLSDRIGLAHPRLFANPVVQRHLLSLPGVLPAVARAGDALGVPLRSLRLLLGRNRHDDARAREALDPLGIVCPPYTTYAKRIIEAHLRPAA